MDKGVIFSLIFALLIGLFALSNSDKVIIDFILTEFVMSQALVILISALLGALIIFLISFFRSMRWKKKIKELKKEIELLNDENKLMKSLMENKEEEDKNKEIEELDQTDKS